ncbi:hypothetical protein D918_01352 [Trichuris suis]|nr:hypothetical protein D918_01352 [Trichuris suis]
MGAKANQLHISQSPHRYSLIKIPSVSELIFTVAYNWVRWRLRCFKLKQLNGYPMDESARSNLIQLSSIVLNMTK